MKLAAWRDDLDISDARRLLADLPGDYDLVWTSVSSYVPHGNELKAQYAFEDLWHATHNDS